MLPFQYTTHTIETSFIFQMSFYTLKNIMMATFITIIKQSTMTSKLPRLSYLSHQSRSKTRAMRPTIRTTNDNNDSFTSSTTTNSTTTSTIVSNNVDDDINNKQTNKKSHKISFGTVQVRQYNIMIGDNPSTRHGPSITYDWEYEEHESIPIDRYEHLRQSQRRTNEEDLFIPTNIRELILKNCGYTEDELEMVQKDIDVIRKQRNQTMKEEIRKIRREKMRKELLSKRRHTSST